jgi:hypothetical protein
VVKNRMDFLTIGQKLAQLRYTDLQQYRYDLNLVWRNAKDYNVKNGVNYRKAVSMQKLTERLFLGLDQVRFITLASVNHYSIHSLFLRIC